MDRPPLRAAVIQTPPAGYLGHLGLKSGGKQPEFLPAALQPVIDMEPYYRLGGRIRLLLNSLALAQNASVVHGTVPAGRVWLLEGLTVGMGAVAGAAANFYFWGQVKDEIGATIWQTAASPKVITGELHLVNSQPAGGVLAMGPGYTISVFCAAAVAPTALNLFTNASGQEVLS